MSHRFAGCPTFCPTPRERHRQRPHAGLHWNVRCPEATTIVAPGLADREGSTMNQTTGGAAVIPDEANETNAVAECPDCEWRSPAKLWWSSAQELADRHNRCIHGLPA